MLEKRKITGFADEIDRDFDIQLRVLKELGQNYVELRSANGINVADLKYEQARELKEKMQQAKIQVSALGSPIGKISVEDDFTAHFAVYQHIVELAALFGTKYIRVFSFYLPDGQLPEKYQDRVFAWTEKLVAYAEQKKVILLHENEKGIYGADAVHCRTLMDTFYGKNYRCVFDFANFVQVGQDTLKAYELLAPYISYIHIKDADAKSGEVVLAGEGDGCVGDILNRLDAKGYDGFLSLEPHLVSFEGLDKLEVLRGEKQDTDGIVAYKRAFVRLQQLISHGFYTL